MSHSYVSSLYHYVWKYHGRRNVTRSIFSRPYGTVDSLPNLKPSNKLLGYYHEVPPGQNLTHSDHDVTAQSDGLR